MRNVIVLVILALAVAAVLVFLMQNDDGRRQLDLSLPEQPRTAEPSIEADPRLEDTERAYPTARPIAGVAEDVPGTGPVPDANTEPAVVHGRVLDLSAHPLAGVGVAAARQPHDVYDVTGQTLSLSVQSAGSSSSFTRERLKEGRSHVVSVSEAATEVALFRDGEEVARLPLQFVPGEVTVVRP